MRGLKAMFNEYGDLLDVDELCELLSIGRNLAYQLLNEKEVKAFRVGKCWKIPRVSIEEYVLRKSSIVKR